MRFNYFKSRLTQDSPWTYIILFLLIFLFINIRQHRITNFGCEICADKAGYYIYLAATFHMGFQASNYPEGFEKLHGDGFIPDRINDKIITKYAAGVAFVLSPFYAAGFVINKLFSINAHPFSGFYLFFINIGAAFYAVLGLFFMKKWLEKYVSRRSAVLTTAMVFTGTNLLYYTLDETLMSHLYSFTMFALVLYNLTRYRETERFHYFVFFALALGVAILIRPTNALFGLIAFLFLLSSERSLLSNLQLIFKPVNILTGLVIIGLVLLPQMIYWKFAFGSYVTWPYRGEGFTNLDSPQILTYWLAPQSGLFLWTPLILISLFYTLIVFKNQSGVYSIVWVTFLITSYLFSAWYTPEFGGCNFGKRTVIEYLPVLMLPLGFLLDELKNYSKSLKYVTSGLISLSVIYNLLLFIAFDTCFFGSTWDWKKFGEFLYEAITFG